MLSQIYKPLGHFPVKKNDVFGRWGRDGNQYRRSDHTFLSFFLQRSATRPQEFIQENTVAWANQIFTLWPGLSQYKIMEYSLL